MAHEQSMTFSQGESFHILPTSTEPVNTRHAKLFQTSIANPSIVLNTCLNVLSLQKLTSRYALNSQFEQYLLDDVHNSDTIVVAVIGAKQIGKSFLIDSLLTAQLNKITRIMCKSQQSPINSPAILKSLNAQSSTPKLVYLDNSGNLNNDLFLWNYFLSSVIILNMSANDHLIQKSFKDCLLYVQSHLDGDRNDLVPPTLIIVIRDCEKQNDKRGSCEEFLRDIQQIGLFQKNVLVINMPYPGLQNTSAKEIVHVPLQHLNPKFTQKTKELLQKIKSTPPKVIKDTLLTTKLLSLTLQPLTSQLNKNQRISTDKIWDDVTQNLSIGYYNYYLKCYQEELGHRFIGEEPVGKVDLWNRLRDVKRAVNKKVQGFKNLDNDPIFSKYKDKVSQIVSTKQQLIKDVNSQKSKQANEKYCKNLLSQLDVNNSSKLLNEYCKSQLDDHKCQVLLQHMGKVLQEWSKYNSKKKSGKQNEVEHEIDMVQKQIRDLQSKINIQKKRSPKTQYDNDAKLRSYQNKKEKLAAVIEQKNHQSKVNQHSSDQLSQEYRKLQEELQSTNERIESSETQMTSLKAKREQQMKNATKQYVDRLKKQQDNLKILEQKLRQAKNRSKVVVNPPKKDNGCCCSLM